MIHNDAAVVTRSVPFKLLCGQKTWTGIVSVYVHVFHLVRLSDKSLINVVALVGMVSLSRLGLNVVR